MKPFNIYTKRSESYHFKSANPKWGSYSLIYTRSDHQGKHTPFKHSIDLEVFGDIPGGDEDDMVLFLNISKYDREKSHISKGRRRLPKDLLTKFGGLPARVKNLLKESGLVSRL